MLKGLNAFDGKADGQTCSGLHPWAVKQGCEFVCVDIFHVDGFYRAKHKKLKTTLIGKKILENSVIFVYCMTLLNFCLEPARPAVRRVCYGTCHR